MVLCNGKSKGSEDFLHLNYAPIKQNWNQRIFTVAKAKTMQKFLKKFSIQLLLMINLGTHVKSLSFMYWHFLVFESSTLKVREKLLELKNDQAAFKSTDLNCNFKRI